MYNLALLTLLTFCCFPAAAGHHKQLNFYGPNHPYISYTGRFEHADRPRVWMPGAYMELRFQGSTCIVHINDQVLYGSNHNYIEYVVDNGTPVRLQLKENENSVTVGRYLSRGTHTLLLCKNTEAGIGYIEFAGVSCERLLPPPAKPKLKIEFYGNSITCGTGSDQSDLPCGKGQWYDQHNAYLSYGPLTARALHAQWQLSAVSGIGLIHSCCNMSITMPEVYDKINMRDDSIAWNFSNYTPDIVTICLGQNDGRQDSSKFCRSYIDFIHQIRARYRQAAIICLSSPMADEALTAELKNYLTAVVKEVNAGGDHKVYRYFFNKRYHHGCGDHPDLAEHKEMANGLVGFIKRVFSL